MAGVCAASPTRASGSAAPARPADPRGARLSRMAHAQARDAVTTPIDWAPIEKPPRRLGLHDRPHRQRRRRSRHLSAPARSRPPAERRSARALAAAAGRAPISLIVVADGLSVDRRRRQRRRRHRRPAAARAQERLDARRRSLLASQARVALGDEVGELLGARAGARADRRAAGAFLARQSRRLPHLRAARRPQGRRAQLRLQHPPRRP